MTDTATHSEECKKAQCATRRRALRMARKRRCEIWIACISSVLSFLLILLVVLLMSFIEFQSRLANSRSDMPPSALVSALLTDNDRLDALKTYSQLTTDFAAKRREANTAAAERGYRIDRICSMFCPALRMMDGSTDPVGRLAETTSDSGRALDRVGQCRFFLAKIPFEGTSTPLGRFQRPPPPETTDRLRMAEVLSRSQLGETILKNFLNAVEGQDDGIAAYGTRLQEQLLRIAETNRHLTVDLEPELMRLQQESAFQCQRVEAYRVGQNASSCSAQWRDTGIIDGFAAYDKADICGRGPPKKPSEPVAGCQKCAGDPPSPAPKADTNTPPVAGGPINNALTVAERKQEIKAVKERAKAQEDNELRWEFVFHFRLYSDLTLGIAQRLILSPPDYLAQVLLLFGGALGAMLNILFKHLAPNRSNRWTDLVVEPVQGMACAIIVFILFRSGFVVISGQQESNDTATLNSYFVAFIAIGAGMLSEQALLAFRNAASALFGRVELRGPERWAPGLKAALGSAPAAPSDVRSLAKRINEKEDAVDKWVRLAEPVPADMQTRIVMALGIEPANIFTDVRPQRVMPPETAPSEPRSPGESKPAEPPSGGIAGGGVEPPTSDAAESAQGAGAAEPDKP